MQGAEREERLSTHNGERTWEKKVGRAQWVHRVGRGPAQPARGGGGWGTPTLDTLSSPGKDGLGKVTWRWAPQAPAALTYSCESLSSILEITKYRTQESGEAESQYLG